MAVKKIKKYKGLSLVETLIASALTLMLILMIYYIFDIVYKMYNQNEDLNAVYNRVKVLLPNINTAITNAGYGFPVGCSLAVVATGTNGNTIDNGTYFDTLFLADYTAFDKNTNVISRGLYFGLYSVNQSGNTFDINLSGVMEGDVPASETYGLDFNDFKRNKGIIFMDYYKANNNDLQDFAIIKAVGEIDNVVGSTVSGKILQGNINLLFATFLNYTRIGTLSCSSVIPAIIIKESNGNLVIDNKVILNNIKAFKIGYRYLDLASNSISNVFLVSTFPDLNNQIYIYPIKFVSSLSYYIVIASDKKDPKYNAPNLTIRTPNGNFTFIPPDRKRRYILIQDQVKLINIFTYTYFEQKN
jgi:hypothetical protein